MEKLIVLNSDDKQDGLNYKCLTPQLKIAPHSQVCVMAAEFEFPAGSQPGQIYQLLPQYAPHINSVFYKQ
mgnify:CR=1 FL=1